MENISCVREKISNPRDVPFKPVHSIRELYYLRGTLSYCVLKIIYLICRISQQISYYFSNRITFLS